MLLRINEELVIKSDRYQFMLCQDKGKQKFPGGVVADYFKPLSYYSHISDIARVEDEKFKEVVKAEADFLNQIWGLKIEKEEASFMGFTAKKDRDCIMVNIGSGYNLYYANMNQALVSCWTHHLRIADEFGFTSNDQSNFGTYDSILKKIQSMSIQISLSNAWSNSI